MKGYQAAQAIRRMERADAANSSILAVIADVFAEDVAEDVAEVIAEGMRHIA